MTSRCKCPKSDEKPSEKNKPYFENITSKMESRRCDLIGKHKHLREKITTMERSIPALIAYNMWQARQQCVDAPYCKVREIMKKFAPYPDQTEKLLASLKSTVQELNGETAELHDKIIDADVKLEETGMELESLELANQEMSDALDNLEKEVSSYTTPSLHSINSEDVLCLSKIHQLAKEELSLKHCIKELELKETLFKEHMDHLLTSKEPPNPCKVSCCMPKYGKPNGHRGKIKHAYAERNVKQSDATVATSEPNVSTKRDREVQLNSAGGEKRSSWVPNWLSGCGKDSCQRTDAEVANKEAKQAGGKRELKEKKMNTDKPEKTGSAPSSFKPSSCKPPSCKPYRHLACPPQPCPPPPCPNFAPCYQSCVQTLRSAIKKSCAGKHPPCGVPCGKMPKCPRKPLCEPPRCPIADHGMRPSCAPCEICPQPPCKEFPQKPGNCRCNCKGKCARGLSEAECNCSDELLDPAEVYQPTAPKLLKNPNEDSNSEDEFCECCSCGCEDSDVSLCQCN